jgi:hypothetical protein
MKVPAVVIATLSLAIGAAAEQVPAPYGLFVHTDGEVKSEYSADLKSTIVELALSPGLADTPSSTTMVLRAAFAGRSRPSTPPVEITILVLPAITSNPNVIRDTGLAFTIERSGSAPLELSYFGRSWGDYGFVPPGGEVTRVAFSMSVPELRALLLAERVSGRVMNSNFVFTSKHLSALRLFAMTIGVVNPA